MLPTFHTRKGSKVSVVYCEVFVVHVMHFHDVLVFFELADIGLYWIQLRLVDAIETEKGKVKAPFLGGQMAWSALRMTI